MGQGLRDLWGLVDPQRLDAAASDQAQRFREAFCEAIAVINQGLKHTAPYGPPAQQSGFDSQRQSLYIAYQKVLEQLEGGDANPASSGVDRVLSAVGTLRDRTQSYTQDTESARNEWTRRESELDRAMEGVTEMEEKNHEKSDALRKVIEAIRSRAYDRGYGESTRTLDQFLPKFDPIYEEFRRQLEDGDGGGTGEVVDPILDLPEASGTGAPWQGAGIDVVDFLRQNPDALGTGAPWAGNEFQGFLGDAWDWATDTADDAWDWTTDTTGDAWDWTADTAGDAWDWTTDTASDAWDWTADTAGDAWGWTTDTAGDAWDWATETASDAKDWTADTAKDVMDWTSETAEDVWTMAKGGESRPLYDYEIKYAKRIFGDHVDYSKIRVTRGHAGSIGSSRTIGDSIHMDDDEFEDDSMKLSKEGIETLIHEITHVHQYQKNGWEYAPHALWEQLKAAVFEGTRNEAYNWKKAETEGLDPEDWNPEQQGKVIEDYNVLLREVLEAEKNGTPVSDAKREKLERMKGHVDRILNAPPEKDIIDKTGEALNDAWEWTSETAGDAWDWASETSGDAWDSAKETASEVWDTASDAWDSATEAASDAWDWTTDTASDAWDSVTDTASDAWDWTTDTAGDAWDSATDAASDAWDWATDTASDAWDSATDTASDAWDTATESASDMWDWATDAAGEAWDSVTDTASDAWDSATDSASELWDWATDTADDAWDSVTDTATDAWDSATESASDMLDWATDTADDAWDSVTDTASDAWDSATDAASDTWDAATDAAGDAWDSATDTASDAWDSAGDLVSSAWDAIF